MTEDEKKSKKFQERIEKLEKYGICPVNATLKVIGGKWKPLVLYFVSVDVNRFGKLQKMMPNCSKRMLTTQLRELEADGIINRKVFAEVPPKVIYSLTPLGESLTPIFKVMSDWAEEHILEPKLKK